jgi:hypothetical protein
MYSWLARPLLRRNLAKLNAGEAGPLIRMDAPDISFRFPGESSWATEVHSAADHAAWLSRLVEVGVQIELDEVVAQGPPWRMTICVRARSFLDVGGERRYNNRAVMWGTIRWGKLHEYEVYEDTQETARLDAYLEGSGRMAP